MCGGTPAYSATQRVRTLRPRRARRPPGRHRASRAAGSASAAAPVLSGLTSGVPLQFTLTRLTVFLKGVLFLLPSSGFEAHGALRNENVTSVFRHRVRRSHPYPGTSAASYGSTCSRWPWTSPRGTAGVLGGLRDRSSLGVFPERSWSVDVPAGLLLTRRFVL